MSHLAPYLAAAWLRDETNGINPIAANVPRLPGDAAPATVTVYDELSSEWLALGTLPSEEADPTIAYPCALVITDSLSFGDHTGDAHPGGLSTDGTVSLAVMLVVRSTDAVAGTRQLMYLVRAARNAFLTFSSHANQAARTAADHGIRLEPMAGADVSTGIAPLGDNLLAVTLTVTFPVTESTVLTL